MEWFNELIGLLIILFLFLFPLLRKFLLARHKKRYPPTEEPMEKEYAYEEKEPTIEYAYKKPPPSKPYTTQRLVKKDFELESEVETREFESQIKTRHLETKVAPKFKERIVSQAFMLASLEEARKKNKIISLTQKYNTMQSMVILSEILGRPKGFPE